MVATYVFLAVLIILFAGVWLTRRFSAHRSGMAKWNRDSAAETSITLDARFARQTAVLRELSILRPQFWQLVPLNAEQSIEQRLIKEQLRIATWQLSKRKHT